MFATDSARYMEAAFQKLKHLFPNLLHMKCFAHIFHNVACVFNENELFDDINTLISKF